MNRWLKDNLTPAQKTYVADIASGLSVKESAASQKVSSHTIRNTISQAKERVGATTTANLIAMAISNKWINLEHNEPPFKYNPSF